jgi:hypothetical protein
MPSINLIISTYPFSMFLKNSKSHIVHRNPILLRDTRFLFQYISEKKLRINFQREQEDPVPKLQVKHFLYKTVKAQLMRWLK